MVKETTNFLRKEKETNFWLTHLMNTRRGFGIITTTTTSSPAAAAAAIRGRGGTKRPPEKERKKNK